MAAERDPSRSFRPYSGKRAGAFSQQSNIKARSNWSRYEYGRQRGHRLYMEQAKRCERFFCAEPVVAPGQPSSSKAVAGTSQHTQRS